jgi:signal transduction histidine kinase
MAPDRVDPEAELDALATALSHDLRAPLRAIDGFSRILLRDDRGALPDDTRRFLELVRDAGTEVADLLDDLVEIVRVTRVGLDVRDVDVGAVAREVIDATPGDVEWDVGSGLPSCRADPTLTRRLLEELLDNAVKYGGARVEVGWDADAEAYFVRDDGIGIAGDLSAQALAIFGRLHAREDYGGGTGAGLALASRIVARHGGRLWGRGALGAGLTVWFTLGAA